MTKGKNRNDLIAKIFKYSRENDSETLAEAFADVYTNKSEANHLSIEIKKVAIEKYNFYKRCNSEVVEF